MKAKLILAQTLSGERLNQYWDVENHSLAERGTTCLMAAKVQRRKRIKLSWEVMQELDYYSSFA